MTLTIPLLCCLAGTVGVSSLASIMVRAAAEKLAADTRSRIADAEARHSWLWHGLEWLGVALILTGSFLPQMWLFTAASQRILTIAAGLEIFCFSNASAAWSSRAAYKREAPGTPASRAAFLAAALVTCAEIALLAVVVWIVLTRLNGLPNSQSNEPSAETSSAEPSEKSVWIDEQSALKALAHLDREYVQGLVESGALHTKTVGGKKMYRADDVEILKTKKKDSIPD